ncbi:hypothetical protein HWV62_41513 [Athelia sp. TMB]|nr:hypothetical protein HWV62_41513 [Athelia sp. TMB]
MPAAGRPPKTAPPAPTTSTSTTTKSARARGKQKDDGDDDEERREREREKREKKAAEKEQKRRAGKMSCAECRRLKLKCDKQVPCESCVRRGCGAAGEFETGEGTRFLLKGTAALHAKIARMHARIRALEKALPAAHPLLAPALLDVGNTLDLHGADPRAASHAPENENGEDGEGEEGEGGWDAGEGTPAGTLQLRADGGCTFLGRAAAAEAALLLLSPSTSASPHPHPHHPPHHHQPQLAALAARLPDYARAHTLVGAYVRGAPWGPGAAVGRVQAWALLGAWYAPARDGELAPLTKFHANHNNSHNSNSNNNSNNEIGGEEGGEDRGEDGEGERTNAHTLALLFALLAHGALSAPPPPTSPLSPAPSSPSSPDNDASLITHALAALKLGGGLGLGLGLSGAGGGGGGGGGSVEGAQALLLLGVHLAAGGGGIPGPSAPATPGAGVGVKLEEEDLGVGECGLGAGGAGLGGGGGMEPVWGVLGVARGVAQSIGLHRDPARWGLPARAVQRRRALFWELFVVDCWMTLITGRLPAFPLHFVDTAHAVDPDEALSADGAVVSSFSAWKARFAASILAPVIAHVLAARRRAPEEADAMALDARIRAFAEPECGAGMEDGGEAAHGRAMAGFMPRFWKLVALTFLHRAQFARAIAESPADPRGAGFVAGYDAAGELLGALQGLFQAWPAETARLWNMWGHAFAAAMMLGTIVIRATGPGLRSKIAEAALARVKDAYELFEDAATYGGKAGRFVPALQDILHKAHKAMNGVLTVPRDIFTQGAQGAPVPDELALLGGETRLLVQRRPKPRSPRAAQSVQLPFTHAPQPSAMLQDPAPPFLAGARAPMLFDAYAGGFPPPPPPFQYSPVEDPHMHSGQTPAPAPVPGPSHFPGSVAMAAASLSRRASVVSLHAPPGPPPGQHMGYTAGAPGQGIGYAGEPQPGAVYAGYQQQQMPQVGYQTGPAFDNLNGQYDLSSYDTTTQYGMSYQFPPQQQQQPQQQHSHQQHSHQQPQWGADLQQQQQHYQLAPQPIQRTSSMTHHTTQIPQNDHRRNSFTSTAMPPPQPVQPPVRQQPGYDDWGSYSMY